MAVVNNKPVRKVWKDFKIISMFEWLFLVLRLQEWAILSPQLQLLFLHSFIGRQRWWFKLRIESTESVKKWVAISTIFWDKIPLTIYYIKCCRKRLGLLVKCLMERQLIFKLKNSRKVISENIQKMQNNSPLKNSRLK